MIFIPHVSALKHQQFSITHPLQVPRFFNPEFDRSNFHVEAVNNKTNALDFKSILQILVNSLKKHCLQLWLIVDGLLFNRNVSCWRVGVLFFFIHCLALMSMKNEKSAINQPARTPVLSLSS